MWSRLLGLLALQLLLVNAVPGWAATTITFEEIPVGTNPGPDKYAGVGVVFPEAAKVVSLPDNARSGSAVLVSADPATEFNVPPLVIQFTADMTSVSLFTGVPWDSNGRPVAISLDAYDAGDQLVAHTDRSVVGPTSLSVKMDVAVPSGKAIRKVSLNVGNHFEYIDDLTFERVGGPIQLPSPPKISFSSPRPGSVTQDGKVTLSGTIEGQGLYPQSNPPKLTVSYTPDPAFQEPPSVSTYLFPPSISGSPPHLGFSLPWQLTHFGGNTLTVEMTNAAGTGRATVAVTYLSQDIVNVFNARGGEATFGKFVWGGTDRNCQLAIYEKGGIFKSRAGVFPSVGKIFLKWLSLRTVTGKTGLGCAQADAQADDPQTYQFQSFERGKIYDSWLGAHHVTEPFLSALDAIGFAAKNGPPASDPVQQGDPSLPLWWQKFAKRYGDVERTASAEIVGNPPTLWVAEPDADGIAAVNAVHAAANPPEPTTAVNERTPTVWRSFPCRSVNGPCMAQPKRPAPYLPEFAGNTACHGIIYGWGQFVAEGLGSYPLDQWMPMPGHEGKITTLVGTFSEYHLSSEDNPLNHFCSVGLSDAGVDWNTYVVPDPAFRNRIYASLPRMQIEYEYCLTGVPTPEDLEDPEKVSKPGDRIYIAGRFIADCAHGFPPEIHPPAAMISVYSVGSSDAAMTWGDLVYFPWWYAGQVATFDLYPPPRPSPKARLLVTYPIGGPLSQVTFQGLNWKDPNSGLEGTYLPQSSPNHLSLKLSGRPVPPASWADGMMLPDCTEWRMVQAPLGTGTGQLIPVCVKRQETAVGKFILRWKE